MEEITTRSMFFLRTNTYRYKTRIYFVLAVLNVTQPLPSVLSHATPILRNLGHVVDSVLKRSTAVD